MRFDLGVWKAFIEEPRYRFRNVSYRVFIYRDVNDHEMDYMHNDGTITRHNTGDLLPQDATPTFEIPEGAARSLMTELWKSGLRPDVDEVKETPSLLREVIAAKDGHLKDVREVMLGLLARVKR